LNLVTFVGTAITPRLSSPKVPKVFYAGVKVSATRSPRVFCVCCRSCSSTYSINVAIVRCRLCVIAGASAAVQVGTANFVEPLIWPKLLDGIREYLQRHDIERIADLVGTLDTKAQDNEWISS